MKDTTRSGDLLAYQSIVTQPVGNETHAEIATCRKDAACSPRATLALSAMDAVRSMRSLLNGLFRPQQNKGSQAVRKKEKD
jgi:hypothetical protein